MPSIYTEASDAAWYKYSATPGQIGVSVIEGHLDSYAGPAVFFRLGGLQIGDKVDVTLADGVTAVFRVTGVREYAKSKFPAKTIYGATNYAALRLITCGGAFDYTTGHYLSSTVVFASLASSHRAVCRPPAVADRHRRAALPRFRPAREGAAFPTGHSRASRTADPGGDTMDPGLRPREHRDIQSMGRGNAPVPP